MPVTVEQLGDQPIIVATFTGFVDLPTVQEMFRRSAEFKSKLRTPFYRITDVTNIETSLKDLLDIVNEASQGIPGSSTDPDIKGMFVGTNKWVGLFQSTISEAEYGSVSIPAFTSREDALNYISRQRDEAAPTD
jgi:hypothetical protein